MLSSRIVKLPPGEVRPAYAPLEQHIAAYHEFMSLAVKADTPGRMTRSEQDLQFFIADTYTLAFIDKDQFSIVIIKRQLPELPGSGPILQHCLFEFVQVKQQVILLVNKAVTENMVQVAVRIKQQNRLKVSLFNKAC